MVTVRIDETDMLNLLMDRVAFWTDDDVTTTLFEMYYENMIESGCFDSMEFNVMSIVDNDYVNWLDVITEDEFENYHIEDEDDERIEARNEEDGETYYLVRCC